MMLVRKRKTNILERRNKFTLFVDRLNDSDVTLLSMVDVENILEINRFGTGSRRRHRCW